ncbi:hypothetical protein EXU85_10400 [Spirosoma sp. KCTC 42546]|uniref:hypothetical protein n=1 Tax=Spirosoma sp. KCTC 42546 TaxID=2520506 RepID=UPI001159376E|nr:hypothetical protein [Spirosoma sp. KCTC 42546]QDK78995.1 hypothetical protein EXU85_10400 [Spirosoma sp. KCTC 42546]
MKQPWIKNARFDGLYVLAPPFLALLVVWLLPERFKTTSEMPLVGWVILVLLVDVAHVYSTLFRTYFNGARFRQQRLLFLMIPLGCYLGGVLLHSVNSLWFWRALAYLAVFHFVRQQYGFMRIYSRFDNVPGWSRGLDTLVIYAATVYPVIWWHLTPGRHFNWFIDGDFVQPQLKWLKITATILYWLLLALYVGKESWLYARSRELNWPRNLLVAGTVSSWYFGIIQFNGDLAFTMLNVVSHGIPYMALIWVSDRPKLTLKQENSTGLSINRFSWLVFFSLLGILAYLEEGLWDGLVWREHATVFGWFQALPLVTEQHLLALLVPLLALPQMTHYVLDGFIWRRKDRS